MSATRNVCSVSAGALLYTRFGWSATSQAATAPVTGAPSRRPSTPTRAITAAAAATLTAAAVHQGSSRSGVCVTTHHAAASTAG